MYVVSTDGVIKMHGKEELSNATKNTNIWVEYLKSRQAKWQSKGLSFAEFLTQYARKGRPFQKDRSSGDHPDSLDWESKELKDYFCSKYAYDCQDLSNYIKGKELKFPLNDPEKTKQLVTEIAEQLQQITQPLRDGLNELDDLKELGAETKKKVINTLASAYIFALTATIFDNENIKEPQLIEEHKLRSTLLYLIGLVMFESNVYEAYCTNFTKGMQGEATDSFKYSPFKEAYSLDVNNALKMFECSVNEVNITSVLYALVMQEEDTKRKMDFIDVLCKIPYSRIQDKTKRNLFINTLKEWVSEGKLGVKKKDINEQLKSNRLKAPKGESSFFSSGGDTSKKTEKKAEKTESKKKKLEESARRHNPSNWGF